MDDQLQQLHEDLKGEKEKSLQKDKSLKVLELKHKKQLQELQLQIQERDNQILQKDEQIAQLKNQIEQLKNTSDQAQSESDQIKFEEFKSQMMKTVSQVMVEKDNKIQELEAKIPKKGSELDIQNMINKHESESKRMQAQLKEMEHQMSSLKENHESELRKLESSYEAQIQELRQQFTDREDRLLADLANEEQRIYDTENNYTTEKETLLKEIDSFKSQLKELISQKETMDDQNQLNQLLQLRVQEKEAQMATEKATLLRDIEKYKSEHQKLFGKYDAQVMRSNELAKENQRLLVELEDQKLQIEQLNLKFEEKEQHYLEQQQALVRRIEELQVEVHNLKFQLRRSSVLSTPEQGNSLDLGEDQFCFTGAAIENATESDKPNPYITIIRLLSHQIDYVKNSGQISLILHQFEEGDELTAVYQKFETLMLTIDHHFQQRIAHLQSRCEELSRENKSLLIQSQDQNAQSRLHFQSEIDRLTVENQEIRQQLSKLQQNKDQEKMNELQSQVTILAKIRHSYEHVIADLTQQLIHTKNNKPKVPKTFSILSPRTSQSSLASSNDLDNAERDRYEKMLSATRQQLQFQETFAMELNKNFITLIKDKEALEEEVKKLKGENK